MKNKLIQIWKDPVLSKVISTGIIAFLIFLYNLIISKINKESFKETFKSFWENKFELWKIASIALIALILFLIFKPKRRKKEIINSFEGVNIETIGLPDTREIYDEQSRELDSKLFNEIRNELLPTEQEIAWLREQNFSYGFNRDVAFRFFDFDIKISDNPNYEFLNPELEKLKKRLVKSIQIFNRNLSELTFPDGNLMQSVPREWRASNPQRLQNSINILNASKVTVIKNYDDLIRNGRKILKI